MGHFIDLTWQKFGRLTAVGRVENDKLGSTRWLCQCSCGSSFIVVYSGNLRRNNTRSCGCLRKDVAAKNCQLKSIHSHARRGYRSKTYITWEQMRQRCNDSNASNYKNYGGRGIKVYQRWRSFENFLEDMGERPPGLTLDRIDNNGDYCKENCKWSTRKEQMRNFRNNRLITINGIAKCLAEHCEDRKLNYKTIHNRLQLGWTTEEAFELIPRKKKNAI